MVVAGFVCVSSIAVGVLVLLAGVYMLLSSPRGQKQRDKEWF